MSSFLWTSLRGLRKLIFMSATKTTVLVAGKTYRLNDSVIPADSRFDRVRSEMSARGIAAYVNARPPRTRNRFTQLFIMTDGTAQLADSRIVHAITAAARTAI